MKKIDLLVAADYIANAYSLVLIQTNIMAGFEKIGIWVRDAAGPSEAPLLHLLSGGRGEFSTKVEIMKSFHKFTRFLVFEAGVEKGDTILIDTTAGEVLTSDVVIGALKKRDLRRSRAIELDGQSPFEKRAIQKRVGAEYDAAASVMRGEG